MKYFLPDSQDLVDPSFDFEKENRSVDRVRHQDDHYAHEVFSTRAFDGILISKAIVDGTGGAPGENNPGPVPAVIPASTSQATAVSNTSPGPTSVNE